MWLVGSLASESTASSPRRRPSPRTALSPRKQLPIAGATVAGRYSSLAGRGFSRFVYVEDPYELSERERVGRGGSRPSSAAPPGASPRPVFKCAAPPQAPKATGAFQRFTYSLDPFERKEDTERAKRRTDQTKSMGLRTFNAGGNARDTKRALKQRMPELRSQLRSTLRSDWPSFVRMAVDERGVLLALFDAERLNEERRADLHAYMNRMVKTHPAAIDFGIARDNSRWGSFAPSEVLNGGEGEGGQPEGARVVYALRPPWVPNDLLAAHRLLSTRPSALSPRH
jgi:hypothetical protein